MFLMLLQCLGDTVRMEASGSPSGWSMFLSAAGVSGGSSLAKVHADTALQEVKVEGKSHSR